MKFKIESIIIESRNDDEPTEITWETSDPVDEAILYGGKEWYLYRYDDEKKSDTVEMSEDTADDDADGNPVQFSGDANCRCPDSPGDGEPCLKIDEKDGLDPSNAERTQDSCNGKTCE